MEEMMYLVKPEGQLPSVNKIIKVKDAFDEDNISDFKVKKITDLRWNGKGELIITMSGNYIKSK